MNANAKQPPQITVLGIGNILLTDEGFGVRVVEKLFTDYTFPDHVAIVDGGVLGISLLAGIFLGSILALTINRPIKTATQAVFDLAHGDISLQIDEKGPEEVRTLLQAVNYLATRLHELENSRKQLLSNLVHELGRPLGALRAAISALQKGAAKDKSTMEEESRK